MGRIYKIIDTAVVVICIPFYLVAIPLICLHEWLAQRRRVRLGLEITHWPARDVREDYVVVDVSRVGEGLVGIRRREWGVLGATEVPPYEEPIEFIPIARFWVPTPFRLGGARPHASTPGRR